MNYLSNSNKQSGRNVTFDIARSLSMIFIIAIHHLSGYTGQSIASISPFASAVLTALGVFSFLSGYLLGGKYVFDKLNDVLFFYKKRLLRIFPMFVLASVSLVFIGMNGWAETIKGLLGISMLWKPAPATLWFVSMLLLFYLLTPLLVNRKWWKQVIYGLLIFLTIFCIDYTCYSVDKRLYFYFLIYWMGIFFVIQVSQIQLGVFCKRWSLIVTLVYSLLIVGCLLFDNQFVRILSGGVGIPVIILCLITSLSI